MKIAVFGSTGTVGKHVVSQALALGHKVSAHTRHAQKFTCVPPGLQIEEGDVLNFSSVKKTTQGQDVVICTLGMPLLNKEGLRAKGTQNIIRAMAETGVSRLICLSGLGAGDSYDMLPFRYRHIIVPLLMRRLYADHEAQEASIQNSALDWIIARPGSFIKGDHTGSYQHGFTAANKSLKFKVSPADVADFLLKQLTDNTYLHRAPCVSY